MIADWPSGYDVERYAEEHGLDFEDITRDIVRIATVAHLVGTGVLDEDFVLTGGMALRLRGSNRFTIKDTDSPLRGVVGPRAPCQGSATEGYHTNIRSRPDGLTPRGTLACHLLGPTG